MSNDRQTHDQGGIEDEKGAKEEQTQKIEAIVGDEALGYQGPAQGEHSGQTAGRSKRPDDGLEDRLADNRPDQIK